MELDGGQEGVCQRAFIPSTVIRTPFLGRRRLAEPVRRAGLYVVQNPAARPLSQEEMDDVYALPYMRNYHPSYEVGRRHSGHNGG